MLEKKVVNGVIINDEGKILLLHRRKGRKSFADYWHTFSGSIEENESPDNCLKREIKEELGITKYTIKKRAKPYLDEISSSIIRFEVYMYLIKTNQKIKIVDKKEHDKFIWIYPKEAKNYKIIPAFYRNLEKLGIQI